MVAACLGTVVIVARLDRRRGWGRAGRVATTAKLLTLLFWCLLLLLAKKVLRVHHCLWWRLPTAVVVIPWLLLFVLHRGHLLRFIHWLGCVVPRIIRSIIVTAGGLAVMCIFVWHHLIVVVVVPPWTTSLLFCLHTTIYAVRLSIRYCCSIKLWL